MTVILARPSVWKSIALINIMFWMVKEGYNCLYVSAEMYAKYMYSRWTSIDLEINNSKIKNPTKLSEAERKKIITYNEKFKNVKNAHFYFDNVITWSGIEQIVSMINSESESRIDAIYC